MSLETPPAPLPRAKLREVLVGLVLALVVGVFYLWTAEKPGDSWLMTSKDPEGYYPLETAGFRAGHLYAAIEPHPALLALKDPYDPVANAPYRVHDMSLYKGHYYLYFGVTPVLILFWPFAALTGRYLDEPVAVALFCSAAVWAGMGLLFALRRRHFPAAPFLFLVAGWVCLAWATPLTLLVEGPQFYQVPISCAIFLQALMLIAVYRALHSEKRLLAWLALAGLLFGLAVGARPNYLACSVVLLVPVFFHPGDSGAGRDRMRALWRRLLAAFVPAAACGIGLLAFNWARFGSVAEFGMHYQLAGEKFIALKQMSPAFLLPHAAYYLFNAGLWQSYFPFFAAPLGQPYGFLRYLPWAWLGLAAFLPFRPDEPGERRGGILISVAVAGAFIGNLAFLACFFGTTARYPGDFANAGLILAGIGSLALGQRAKLARLSWLAGCASVLLAAVSLFFGMAVYTDGFPTPDYFTRVARMVNGPAYAWQRSHGEAFGGLRMDLKLPDHPPELPEPLFETGRQPDARDWLQIEFLPEGMARLGFFHAGTGLLSSRSFAVPSDRRIVVEARCGSLLPPFGHPLFADWTRSEFDSEKRDLQLKVDGVEVLRTALDCYESSPMTLSIGRHTWFTGGMQQAFSGVILKATRMPLEKPPKMAPLFKKPAPVELTLFLPTAKGAGADPLLVTGSGKESDLLYCVYDGANRLRFALDHFGSGGPESEWVAYDPLAPHGVKIWMGSMAGASSSESAETALAAPDRLVVIFDGRALLNVDQVFYPSTPETVILGYNAYGSTAAGREFSGRIAGARQVDAGTLPSISRSGSYGAVEMSVDFPFGAMGAQEPLVVTGVTGAGDFVYVHYLDPRHLSIGFDHWGIGGIVGKPVEVDYGQTHRLAISFPALYPPGSPLNKSKAVRVLLDGRVALDGVYACHPSTSDEIKIGKNPIGGSTCGPSFTGWIVSVERFPQPRP